MAGIEWYTNREDFVLCGEVLEWWDGIRLMCLMKLLETEVGNHL